ncbi:MULTISPECIES: Yip1 family protein [unclassified Dinoroseobacter]|uniref:Yip1 family protein n=1 Tax=unclassified Dinoroseobacter TaxID=2620028 RepID=UPI003C7B0119
MTFTPNTVLNLVVQTIKSPQEGASTILSMGLARNVLMQLLGLVVVASVITGQLGVFAMGGGLQDGAMTGPFLMSPMIATFVQFALLIVLITSVHVIGRALGGRGSFEETLSLVIWLQFILLCLQVVQILALILFPVLGALIGLVSIVLFFWLLVNFIAVIHGFTSLGLVLVGVIISAFGILFAMSLILAMLGLSFPGSL